MRGIAYSYLRFSTPEQAMGDSRRRQLALAEDYARKHGLLLDCGLNFRDLGVSAFRGRNAKEGALRAFLDAVEHGLVPANSYLLVESLDRLSRDRILPAQALFLQIVHAGVTIVTLMDQRSYSAESLNANPTDLIISLVYMMRANEESATKSARLKAYHAARRDNPKLRFHGSQCPGWLRPNEEGTGYVVIPDNAAVVQRIFRESLAGHGLHSIARDLNAEGLPLFRRANQRGKLWTRELVRHYLHSSRAIGTYVPCRGELVDGAVRFMPGEPRPGYYPAIVSEHDWNAVQDRRNAWAEHYKTQGRRMTVANILVRLARCPFCGRAMNLTRTAKPNQRYLSCMAWRESRTCSHEWVRFPEIEDVFIADVEHFIRRCPQPQLNVDARRAMLRRITGRLAYLRDRLKRERAAHGLLAEANRAGRSWPQDTQAEIKALLDERYQLRVDRSYWQDATLSLKLDALRDAVKATPRDLARINERLRALLVKVVVDWPNERLTLHWRHGGQSTAEFWRRRQRGKERNTVRPLDDIRRRPHNFPPGDPRHEPMFEGEFARHLLAVLSAAVRPMQARELALSMAEGRGEVAPEGQALITRMAKIRRTLGREALGTVRLGTPGTYGWRLAREADRP